MGDLSIQRQNEEVVIRLNVNSLDKEFLDKLRELLFWEYAFRKAGFSDEEIQRVFKTSRQTPNDPAIPNPSLTEAEIKTWTDEIERQWWEANADVMLQGVTR